MSESLGESTQNKMLKHLSDFQETSQDVILEHYGCPQCGIFFTSEMLYNKHIPMCSCSYQVNRYLKCNDILSNTSDVPSTSDNRASKQKPINPLSNILNGNEISSCADNHNKNLGIDLKDDDVYNADVTLQDPLYIGTSKSKILSRNEMLITLPYEGSNSKQVQQQSNAKPNVTFLDTLEYTENESNMFQTDYRNNENIEIMVENLEPVNIGNNSSIKILTVLSSSNFQQIESTSVNRNDETIANSDFYSFDDDSNEHDDQLKKGSNLVSDFEQGEFDVNLIIEKVVESLEECDNNSIKIVETKIQNEALQKLSPKQKTKPSFSNKKQLWDSKTGLKTNSSKIIPVKKKAKKTKKESKTTTNAIDLDPHKDPLDESPFNEDQKHNATVRTYKNKTVDNIELMPVEKMYTKIPPPTEQEPVTREPDKLSVFDFYDEDMELRKQEQLKIEKETQLIKERSCIYCKEIFKDPMDVLRHKREFHNNRKVLVTIEELEPYLGSEKRTHCPLCFKQISNNGFKSMYIKHLMVHCKNAPFKCKVCGKKFKRKDHLENHEVRHIVPPQDVG